MKIDQMVRRGEDQRAGLEHVRQRARIIFRIGRDLGKRLMPSDADEIPELTVAHWRVVDPKAADTNAMNRRLFWIKLVRSHAERAAKNPHHIRRRRPLGPLH